MGFLNNASSGYKKFKNTQKYTNNDLYSKLSQISVSFGTPILGVVGKKEAVVYEKVADRYDVYVKADKKNIEVAKAFSKDASIGKNLLKEMAVATVSDANAKDTVVVDRAVDELADIVERLLAGEDVKESNVTAPVGGESLKYYMKQKVLAIRDKYNICTLDEEPAYWVQGNITGLQFSVQDAGGQELIKVKKAVVAVTPEYTLYDGKKKLGKIKKKIKITRPEIVGNVDGKEITIKGDMAGYSFNILVDGKVVGNVDTERLTWGDCYSIEVLDESLKDLIVTIAVICDNTLK